jgi:hypothetical protein
VTLDLTVGDMVTTGAGRHYYVRHRLADGRYLLEPVRRAPGRRGTVARAPRLVRTMQLSRAWGYARDARRHVLEGRDNETVARAVAGATTWLRLARNRGQDGAAELAWAAQALSHNISHMHERYGKAVRS